MYENESEVGQGVIDSGVDREEIFITTKINTTNWTPSKGNGPSLQNKDIDRKSEQSLTDWQTDYVENLLKHWHKFKTKFADRLAIL